MRGQIPATVWERAEIAGRLDLMLHTPLVRESGAILTLQPLRCSWRNCRRFAATVDVFHPYHDEQTRCATHAGLAAPEPTP